MQVLRLLAVAVVSLAIAFAIDVAVVAVHDSNSSFGIFEDRYLWSFLHLIVPGIATFAVSYALGVWRTAPETVVSKYLDVVSRVCAVALCVLVPFGGLFLTVLFGCHVLSEKCVLL